METVGRYELLEKLGQGGMGVVYRATDTLLQRVVAIKLISAPIEQNAELRERFFREARAAGQLSHKNIITIHDLGEHEDRPFLAMELLDGEDLQRRLARGHRMSLARKLDLAIEMCEALEYAHSHGVIHRDIKPANIFITPTGVKLLDFGLARLVSSELTNSNMMMGTLNYMAPEQVRGERADHRSDIFSTGVVLYELLSGRKAFQGDSFASTLFQILEGVPEALQAIDATLPVEVVAIVERALAKQRDARYQQTSDLLRDLVAYRQVVGVVDSPAGEEPAVAHRPPSNPPHPSALTPRTGVAPMDSWRASPPDAPTALSVPTPLGSMSPARQSPVSPVPSSRSRASVAIVAVAAVLAVVAGVWFATHRPRTAAVPEAPRPAAATPGTDQAAIDTALQQAVRAFQAEDFAGAQRNAEAVLARAPGHEEARRLRDRARSAAETVEKGLRQARTFYDAGRYEEASRAAGDVLSIAPGNADARRIMGEGAARSRGRGAEEARIRMEQSRAAARGAAAPKLASGAFNAASSAERDAERLYKAGRLADATAKFYEASGLYRSAEIAAQNSVTAAAVPPAPAPAEARPPQREPLAAAPPAPATTTPERPLATPPAPPPAPEPTPAPVPAPPAPAVVPPPLGVEPATPAASADDGVADLLTRYKAALEARSLDALKRLWPSLGGAQQTAIQNEFEHARRIDVEISAPKTAISGATATVSFLRRYELQTIDGQQLRTRTQTTMTLRRAGGGWVIEQIRFDPVR